MIVRILGEGRFDVPGEAMDAIEAADRELVAALDSGDGGAFDGALARLVDSVRSAGTPLSPDDLSTSELVVPHPGSSLDEVKQLLAEGS